MTTKYKIISGFVLMVVLMGGIALWGYKDLGDASERFSTYRRYARINVYTSEMMVNLGAAGIQANAFMLSRDPKALEVGTTALDALDALFAKAIGESKVEENVRIMTELRADAVKYKAGLANLGTSVINMNTQYTNVIAPNGLEMAKRFHQLAQNAKLSQNVHVLGLLEEAWGEYSMMLSALGRYNYSRRDEDIAAVDSRRERLKPLLQSIGTSVITPEARASFADLEEAAAAMFKGIEEMERYAHAATENITALAAMRTQFSEDVLAFSTKVDSQMQEIGRETLAANTSGQNQLLFASVGGVILGVLLAVFIIVGIVRVLAELSGFAAAIAAGDFSRQIKIHEKGEIGGMVDAMRRIPEVLQRVISDVANGVVMIQGGHFRARLDPAAYAGSYGELVSSVNTVAEAYTEVLDELPLPILSADTSLAVRFTNTVGKEVVGGKLLESYVTDGSARFGKTAMENKRNFSAEATIANNGKEMHFAVTTVPLVSKDAVVGFIEILSDLTEIWTQQRVMLQVAHEASEISNRVAAASEELAAQVEQVSRGAEVQRSRIESTASAMTEMNATVIEVAKSAGEASEQSEGTRSKAAQGAELVNKVVQSINQVNSVGQNLQTNMQELGKQAESIGNVMNVISDIADQTNLLALNAAIEAARAGEAGRGFAVVADEVRKLAEKTMEATQEVGTSISAVQQSARVNIGEVGKAVASVAEANELATSSGQALAEIVSLASANSAVVASIATAAEEQSATSEEISRAIDEINLIVGETTEGMVQSSSAVQDLSRMAQELRRVMEGLK